MKKLSHLFSALAILLWGAMCATVAWIYHDILCGMEHLMTSAPPRIAFFYAIPFALAISVCVVLSIVFRRKSK